MKKKLSLVISFTSLFLSLNASGVIKCKNRGEEEMNAHAKSLYLGELQLMTAKACNGSSVGHLCNLQFPADLASLGICVPYEVEEHQKPQASEGGVTDDSYNCFCKDPSSNRGYVY